MFRAATLILFSLFFSVLSFAQSPVSGKVTDGNGSPIPGASVFVRQGDKLVRGAVSDANGAFVVDSLLSGSYSFNVTSVGFASFQKDIKIKPRTPYNIGVVRLKEEDKLIDEVKVVSTVVRQEQHGDTTVFNAAAFKVNPDATTEDLLRKIPGMEVKNGSVSHGGETVKKVLVDGKEFFGDDPSIALKNIDADMVDKIEVFDKQSEQAQFTGFSDGNEERTINILTKMGVKSGRFGRVYGGYGTGEHYEAGGNANFFRGAHRFSAIGMLNNVNQQNYSQDGASDISAGSGRGGLTTTGSAGLNYSLENDNKIRIESSYFFGHTKRTSSSTSLQEYFQDEETDSVHTYQSLSDSRDKQNEHRVNLRLNWTISETDRLVIEPTFSWTGSDNGSSTYGSDLRDSVVYQSTAQTSDKTGTNWSIGGKMTWKHRFSLPRRTLSLSLSASGRKSTSDGDSRNLRSEETQLYSTVTPADAALPEDVDESDTSASTDDSTTPPDKPDGDLAPDEPDASAQSVSVTSQLTANTSSSQSYSARLMYTEPFGDHVALQVNYQPSYSISSNDKAVSADTVTVQSYTSLADVSFQNFRFAQTLSNKKESRYLVNRAGVGLNFLNGKKFRATVGLDVQNSRLEGEQTYPYEFTTRRTFFSLMPSAELSANIERRFNVRFSYRSSSNAPSINQLQDVVDVSDVRKYSAGNPDLNQSVSHSVRLHCAFNNPKTSRFLFLMSSFSFTQDYIASSSVMATVDSVLSNGITLPAGTQLSQPVNLDGYMSGNVNLTFSTPLKWLGCNLGLSLGARVSRTPGFYNGNKVESHSNTINGGVNLSTGFSENTDVNISYNPSYNIMSSSQTAAANYNYYGHTLRATLSQYFWQQRFVFSTSVAHNFSSGMGDQYDQNNVAWNAALGVKFLSRKQAELRLRVSDILNSAQSSSRSIQDAYISTSQTDVIGRYAMLTFTYKFKDVGGASEDRRRGPRGGGPGSGGPGGGREGGHGGPPPMGGMGGGPGM